MSSRNRQSTGHRAKIDSDQVFTRDRPAKQAHRPTHGALHPVLGTIEAPIVVIGASGTIGTALVHQLTAAGQPVIAVGPLAERLGTLRDEAAPATVMPLAARVENDDDARQLADRLRAMARPIAGVVVTFPHGRSTLIAGDRNRLLDQTSDELCDCLRQTLLAQHALARHLIPLLAESGRNSRYVIVGGPGSEMPWAGYGHRSVAMAATRMLARVLHDEALPAGVRVHLLSIDSPVRSEIPGEHECPEWPAASDIAGTAMRLLDSTATDLATEAVVTPVRSTSARSTRPAARPYADVPSFLESLRTPPHKTTPQ